jgi:2-(1,2-epoxy-1,2-dihydrophenyl)acetyl-CoA isomerase
MAEIVLYAVADGVARIAMNRPAALNALNRELTDGLRAAVARAENDPAVRCVAISGGENFMAGGDLKWFGQSLNMPAAEKRALFLELIDDVHGAIRSLRRMPKPVLASVDGAAAGFGLSLMLACDLVVATERAYFTLAYSLIGVTPDGGSTFALPRVVGAKKAMEIALLGERFDAATAKALGLVNWVVPAEELAGETSKIAARLAAGPTAVYGRTKALLNQSLGNSLETQLQREAEAFADAAGERDFAEGVGAFLAKRKPTFAGKP